MDRMFCNHCNDWAPTNINGNTIRCIRCNTTLALTRQPRFGDPKAKPKTTTTTTTTTTDEQTTTNNPERKGIQDATETKLRSEAEPARAPNVFDKLARGSELRDSVSKQSKRKQRKREQTYIVVRGKKGRTHGKR